MKIGQVAELVYALVLGTSSSRIEGSSPSLPTVKNTEFISVFFVGQEKLPDGSFVMDPKGFSYIFEQL